MIALRGPLSADRDTCSLCIQGELEANREQLEEFREEVGRAQDAQEEVVRQLQETKEEAKAALDAKVAKVEALEVRARISGPQTAIGESSRQHKKS